MSWVERRKNTIQMVVSIYNRALDLESLLEGNLIQ